jgi:hypothetical protein
MNCIFCKGTGKIKQRQLMPDSCPTCNGQVFLYEAIIDDTKRFQYVCVNCGSIAMGMTDVDHDLTRRGACVLYRGPWEDYARIMKERHGKIVEP